MACENCNASYTAETNWSIDCHRCGQTILVRPRKLIIANIVDKTESLEATIFGDDAAKIMNKNACTVMKMHNVGMASSLADTNHTLQNKLFMIKLNRYYKTRHDGVHDQYTSLNLIEIDDKERSSLLVSGSDSTKNILEEILPNELVGKTRIIERLFSSDVSDNEDVGSSA